MADMLSILQQLPGAETVEVNAKRPLWVDRPDQAYFVATGRIDLFLSARGSDDRPGPRRPLGSLEEGQVILGNPAFQGLSLLAVGGPTTQLLRLPRTALAAAIPDDERTRMVERWLRNVSEWTIEQVPSDTIGVYPNQPITVSPGKRINSAQHIAWADTTKVALSYNESESLAIPQGVLFPIPRTDWVICRGDGELRLVDTATALAAGEGGWRGLVALQTLAFQLAVGQAQKDREREDARIAGRDLRDRNVLAGSLAEMALVMPGAEVELGPDTSGDLLYAACELVGKAEMIEMVRPITLRANLTDPITAISDTSRCRVRKVFLRDTWYKTDSGAILAFLREDNSPVAVLPAGSGSYRVVDPRTGHSRRVDRRVAEELSTDAYTFYRPLPDHRLGLFDLIKFLSPMLWGDFSVLLFVGIAGGILNLVLPIGTGLLVSTIIPSGVRSEVGDLAGALLVATLANTGFNLVRALTLLHLEGKLDGHMQSALMDRLINLPAPFFRGYSTGDLANRVLGINAIRKTLSGAGITSLLGAVFSIFSFGLLFYYSWKLAIVACFLVFFNFIVLFVGSVWQLQYQRELLDLAGQIAGRVFQLLTGVNKIRVAGAEARAFRHWSSAFARQRVMSFKVGMVNTNIGCFSSFYSVFTSGVLFGFFAHFGYEEMSVGDFLSFFAAFGQFMGAIGSIGSSLNSLLTIGPTLDRAQPILKQPLEVATRRPEPAPLKGRVEMNDVNFRYRADGPFVLHDVTLYADPGEFVAIVGPSGAGKSTMLRLLLGFETPEQGTILYDGQNIQSINAQALRRQIGVVLQNSFLMAGDVFSNIVGSTLLTLDDAWEAAELAGLAEDIRAMPMGMHTVIMEGSAGFSGGQRQRLLIARAVVSKPRVLFFDEATSALDSDTQEAVSRGLERLQSTRIVIAHRLSTIRRADRIYVISDHTVAQVGTYDELVAVPGVFQDLAKRQLV